MPRFNVTVVRQATQFVTIETSARTEDSAISKAEKASLKVAESEWTTVDSFTKEILDVTELGKG